jgi:HAE1 family hydrophobic/amphiphilic exporter-1
MQTPPGSSITFTDDRFKQVENFVMSRPEVDHYFGHIGGFSGGDVNSGFLFLILKDRGKRPIAAPFTHRPSQAELMVFLRKELNKIPDAKVVTQDLSLAGFSTHHGFPIEFTVRGPNWDELALNSEKLRDAMRKSKLMVDVDTDYQANVSEVRVVPDRVAAAKYGVDVDVIATTINALVGGQPIAKYTQNGRRYDVRVRLIPSDRNQADQIKDLQVWNNRGELVKLADVVTIKEQPASLIITRENRERAITLSANVAPNQSQTAALADVKRLAKDILPQGYRVVLTGSAQTFQESFASLLLVLFLGVIVSYMILGSQFNSFVHPVSILFALPFSISGALIGLFLGRQSINLYSLIGIILLMGIVKKNSILLVDFTNQLREQGVNPHDALLQACPIRLRPILMTSVATIAAAIPPALAMGPGAETRTPMAVAVIGGVIFSTVLTLLVVPCVYSYLTKLEHGGPALAKPVSK